MVVARPGMLRLPVRPSRANRARLVFALLLAFTLRALIPLGFMPASDGSLALMICPAGFPVGLLQSKSLPMAGGMRMPAHQHHGRSLMDEGYCTFTNGFSPAPPPLLLAALIVLLSCIAVVAAAVLAPGGIRLVHLPQARAPPAPL